MGNVLFIHAVGLTPYALKKPLPLELSLEGYKGGPVPAFQYLVERIDSLSDVERAVVVTDLPEEEIEAYWNNELGPIVRRERWNAAELLKAMQAEVSALPESDEKRNLFVVWGDAPLLDTALSGKMYKNHRRYFADYTFADGYPRGLTPEILRETTLPQLIELAERHSVAAGRDFIFNVVQKDINAFDLETEVAPTDQRLLRVFLTADTRRNFHQLNSIIEAGGTDAESVQRVLSEKPELLRTLPAYVNVQISEGCPQTCSYCPYPEFGGDILNMRGEMPLERWKEVVESIEAFCGDATIGISLWGEPALHSHIVDLVAEVMQYPALSLVVETSGVGWTMPVLEELGRRFGHEHEGATDEAQDKAKDQVPVANRLSWIVSLDAHESEMYNTLRGPQWEEALATIEFLRKRFAGNVYVQAVRMEDNEEQLDQFYRYWKQQEGVAPIVQKYDSFCGALPERKVTDLSPIRRFPCWHLKRDLSILIDGSVPMCREDLHKKYILGNIFQEDIVTVWERGSEYYQKHINEDYPEICRSCDEYYTYNF